MFVKVRDDFRQMSIQKVSPAGFWVTVGIAVVLVCLINVDVTHEGKYAAWSRRGDWLYLTALWAGAVYIIVSGFVRHRKWIFPLPMLAGFIAITLNIAGHELPRSTFAASWVQNIANVLFLVWVLSLFLQFGWGRRQTSADNPPGPAA